MQKTLGDDLIPNDLLDRDQRLREFWSVKKGVRSERVFHRVINKLREDPAVRRSAPEAAANAGWPDVYEPRQPGGRQQQQATDWDALENHSQVLMQLKTHQLGLRAAANVTPYAKRISDEEIAFLYMSTPSKIKDAVSDEAWVYAVSQYRMDPNPSKEMPLDQQLLSYVFSDNVMAAPLSIGD